MKAIELTFPDGRKKNYPPGITPLEVAKEISPRLANAVVAAKIEGDLRDVYTPINDSSKIELIKENSPEGLDIIRHSAAHVMARAISELYPGTLFAIGPVIKNGFYYDVESPHTFHPDDFPAIEKKMQETISSKRGIRRREMKIKDAIEHFSEKKDIYKVELLNDLLRGENPPEMVSLYRQGDFEDLCRGPHLPHAGFIKAFKLTSLAGAYFRGDETRQMLQRIYATSWGSKKDQEAYLKSLEEAKKRDHRVLGKQLDLFSFHPESSGNVFFHHRGTVLYNLLVDYIRNILFEEDYQEFITPQILSVDLWKQSGHYDNYREAMYFVNIEGKLSAVKPMNCPGSLLIYKTHKHSYRELPLRFAELGIVHRHEKSGVTHGLMRVRKFTQDDAHIFCTEDQIEGEVGLLVKTIVRMYRDFGFEKIDIRLATRPEKAIGSVEIWQKAEKILKVTLEKLEFEFEMNIGEGAFYGPKIDFDVYDALGRPWQLGTIQLDFSMPERFELSYIGADGEAHRPVMIHRAVYGSLERFIGVLIEHYGGNLPMWLSPLQVRILSVSEKHVDYARKVYDTLKEQRFRVELDCRDQKLGYKIREAELQKCPYILIVGEREVSDRNVSVRSRIDRSQKTVGLEAFIEKLRAESRLTGSIIKDN